MDMQEFFTSSTGTGIAMWIGRNMPPRVGHALVRLFIPLIASRKESPLVRSIRANQSVVRNLPLDAPELDQVVHEVLGNAGRAYYEAYHRIALGKEAVQQGIIFSPEIYRILNDAHNRGEGTVVVGPHLGNLDLGLAGFAAEGLSIQAITYAVPPGGYEMQNRMRADSGYIITPADARAAKMALMRLREGGIVVTGVDRPLTEGDTSVRFFDLPTQLPTGYTRLALSTNSQVVLIWIEWVENGYYVNTTGPIELTRTGKRKEDVILNTERILELAAEKIRAQPAEWMLFHPVWPQLMN
jgi:KDO2-lipid IV(A) lauroyltransferase